MLRPKTQLKEPPQAWLQTPGPRAPAGQQRAEGVKQAQLLGPHRLPRPVRNSGCRSHWGPGGGRHRLVFLWKAGMQWSEGRHRGKAGVLGEGREAHPGSAGQCTQRPRDRVVAGPGSGPRAAQAPPDTVVHHPRSRRGTHSAVCSGQQSRWAPFRDWGSRSSGGPRPAALLPACSPVQCSGSQRARCSPRGGHPHRGCGPGSSSHHPHSRAGRCR